MTKQLTLPDEVLQMPLVHGFRDHFSHYVDAALWTKLVADSGSAVAGSDAAGGVVSLVTGGVDNDEVVMRTTQEPFKFANNKPLDFRCRLKWAEANTDDANVLAGLMDAMTADCLLDDGGGPKASYSGAVFFKLDGGTKWNFETSLAGAQTTTELAATAPNGASDWHSLKIEARSRDATTIEIIPYIDENGGQDFKQCLDANGNKVMHTITLGSPTEMRAGVAAKAGGANVETVSVDYASCYQAV